MSSILASVDQRTQLAGHNRLELLLFRLSGGQEFGINVFKVQEVIQCPPLTHVPHSHPVVCGIANMRGKTIPVMDLSRAIGVGDLGNPQDNFVVITEYNRTVQGFLVRSVDRIINMNWESILPPPTGSGGGSSYLTAVTRVDDELVEIIDVEKVMAEVMPRNEEVSAEVMEDVDQEENVQHHVLVADDSSVARNQIKRTLDRIGINCTLVNDGREALEKLQEWAADEELPVTKRLLMVISDVEMPEMDGYTLTKHIRSDPRMQDLYVMLHTSLSGVFNNAMVETVGANEFLAKFQPDEFAKKVMSRISAKEGQQAA